MPEVFNFLLHQVGPEGLLPRIRMPVLVCVSCTCGFPFWGELDWLFCHGFELELRGWSEHGASFCSLAAFAALEQLELVDSVAIVPWIAPLEGLGILVER